MDKSQKELIKTLRNEFLKDYPFKPTHLLPHLSFLRNYGGDLRAKENSSLNEAINTFLDIIVESKEPGVFQKFITALKTNEFTKAASLLEGRFHSTEPALQELLTAFYPRLVDEIIPSDIMPTLFEKKFLSNTDMQEIMAIEKSEGARKAMIQLLSYTATKSVDWLAKFIYSLKKHDGYSQIADDMLGNCENKMKSGTISITIDGPSTSDTLMNTVKQQVLSLVSNHHSKGDSIDNKKISPQLLSKSLAQVAPRRSAELQHEDTIAKKPCYTQIRLTEQVTKGATQGLIAETDIKQVDLNVAASNGPSSESNFEFDSSSINSFLVNNSTSLEPSPVSVSHNSFDDLASETNSDLSNSVESGSAENGSEGIRPETLILRSYQEELVEDAKKEKNCIISAPTGSGKTLVALEIIRDHLANAPIPGERKVVFFVPTVPLVRQQYKQIKKYLHQFQTVSISGATGGEANLSVSVLSKAYEILVMTPQILVDALNRNNDGIDSLAQFSLLVFDECHHTFKGHAYNKIMNFYLDEKFMQLSPNLPQIVGLTASVGTEKAKNGVQVIDHILQLCANLDCWTICTVKVHKAELLKYSKSPEQDIIEVPTRQTDPFKDTVTYVMGKIENKMRDYASRTDVPGFEIPGYLSTLYGTEKYTQLLSKLDGDAHTIFDQKLRRFFISCTEHLKAYNGALLINDDCRSEDALDYLQKALEKLTSSRATPEEKNLFDEFKNVEGSLQKISRDPLNINPKLSQLKKSILQTYAKNSDMRCILFCKTREMTLALTKWINDEIKILKAHHLTGAHTGSDNTGLTQNKQENVIELFKNGEYKVIVATSIGEEGLDITKCNFVIRYEYATNETAMVQAKGRTRAGDSEYILVTDQSKGIAEKEFQNKLRENLMNIALQEISNYSEIDLKKRIIKLQEDTKKERDRQKQIDEMQQLHHGSQLIKDKISLHCRKCDNFCCFSIEIAKTDCHYVAINTSLQNRVKLEPHPKPMKIRVGGNMGGEFFKQEKLLCKQCNQDWGVIVLFKNIKLPVVKIESFIMYVNVDQMLPPVKKWKDVKFDIRELTDKDIEQLIIKPMFDC